MNDEWAREAIGHLWRLLAAGFECHNGVEDVVCHYCQCQREFPVEDHKPDCTYVAARTFLERWMEATAPIAEEFIRKVSSGESPWKGSWPGCM